MHVILGATGHVGSALAQHLLQQGEPVTVVTRDERKAPTWRSKGAQVAVVDVHHVEALREVFQQGTRLFLLNPPADPSTDTVAEERRSLAAVLAAIEGSGLEKIVAQSTYGAQPGDGIGDLGVLYEMEKALAALPIPSSIIRAAYYMSNWDIALETARREGKVYSNFPPAFQLPMVAPADLGRVAAGLMTEPTEQTGLYYVEGPGRYSTADVAEAFAVVLGQPVEAVEIPLSEWQSSMKEQGFSDAAARSYAEMTRLTLEGPEEPLASIPGSITLQQYVRELVENTD